MSPRGVFAIRAVAFAMLAVSAQPAANAGTVHGLAQVGDDPTSASVSCTEPVEVPDLRDLTYSEAKAATDERCLVLVTDDPLEGTLVLSQDPLEGTIAKPRDEVAVEMGVETSPPTSSDTSVETSTAPETTTPETTAPETSTVTVTPTQPTQTTSSPRPTSSEPPEEASTDPVGWWSRGDPPILLLAALALVALVGGLWWSARLGPRRQLRWVGEHVRVAATADPRGPTSSLMASGDEGDLRLAFVVVRRAITSRLEALP